MTGDILQRIQALQFDDRSAAEALLLAFIRETYPYDVASVELRPLAISLNSFNGTMTLEDGRKLFFKTHTESDTIIGEYYNAELLAQASYPIIRPIFSSTVPGKQFLVYELIESPSVFDLAWDIETGRDTTRLVALTAAQNAADDDLFRLFVASLDEQSAEDAAGAAIHQLFYHRLTGGRLERFYGPLPGKSGDDVTLMLPDGPHQMREVRRAHWIINGQRYDETLDDIITRSCTLLNPAQPGPSIIGHGDAHNGNVFFQADATPPALMYFDPAFAGHHHPLLDLTKPLFHNVFAMWMYFPGEKREKTAISLRIEGASWHVRHDYAVPEVRRMFLASKVNRVLVPILVKLKERGLLRPDWRAYLKAALFCCPFLTMNLADPEKFPPEISLLGLSMAMEMGSESLGRRSLIDETLDEVEGHLR